MTRGVRKARDQDDRKRDIPYADAGQSMYARVTSMLGNGRVKLVDLDRKEHLGVICGRMRKRVWIRVGDIVLATHRGFQEGKVDIVFKYMEHEARMLVTTREIPNATFLDASIPFDTNEEEQQHAIVFQDEEMDIAAI